MFKGLGDMAKLMQQAQQMQEKFAEAQARVTEIEAEGVSGGGMIHATVNGKGELRSVRIDPVLLNRDDGEMLQDLIVAAVNDAQFKAQEAAQRELSKVTEGLGLPPGMKLPFG